jgi:hypothetical protein
VDLRAGVLLAGLVVAALALSCGNGTGRATPTASVAPTPTGVPTVPPVVLAGDPSLAVANLVQACREKSVEGVRGFVAAPVRDSDIEALFALGTDLQLLSQTVPSEADGSAEVTVRLRVYRNGETEDVERTWELERTEEGIWLFTELPACY